MRIEVEDRARNARAATLMLGLDRRARLRLFLFFPTEAGKKIASHPQE
jgi:hypothetical protein